MAIADRIEPASTKWVRVLCVMVSTLMLLKSFLQRNYLLIVWLHTVVCKLSYRLFSPLLNITSVRRSDRQSTVAGSGGGALER